MIAFDQFRESYDWKLKASFSARGKTEMYEATRKLSKIEEYEHEFNIKVITGVAVRISTSETLLEDLHEHFSPLIASVRGQCDLVTAVEAWTYKPLEKHRKSTRNNERIVKVVVQEKFGEDLASFIEKARTEQAITKKVDRLAHFLIRFASMIEQRGLYAPNITPNAILLDNETSFKLNGTFEGALRKANDEVKLFGINSTYSTSLLRITKNEPELSKMTEEWRFSDELSLNELCSLGMTMIQLATGTKLAELEAIRKAESKRQMEQIDKAIASLLQHHPSITNHLKAAVMMLGNAEYIYIVAKHSNNDQDDSRTKSFQVKSFVIRVITQTRSHSNRISLVLIRQLMDSPLLVTFMKTIRNSKLGNIEDVLKSTISLRCIHGSHSTFASEAA